VTLGEAIGQREVLDRDATIYAAAPWTAGARAVVAVEPEDGSLPAEAAGLEYFLEVAIALDVADMSDAATRFEHIVYYAQHDAYLPDD
jgi:hypothetical protein